MMVQPTLYLPLKVKNSTYPDQTRVSVLLCGRCYTDVQAGQARLQQLAGQVALLTTGGETVIRIILLVISPHRRHCVRALDLKLDFTMAADRAADRG